MNAQDPRPPTREASLPRCQEAHGWAPLPLASSRIGMVERHPFKCLVSSGQWLLPTNPPVQVTDKSCLRCIGSILVCASQNIGMLVVGRFINGLCVGIASAQVPVYIAELAPPSKRGRLVGCQQWAITWGILSKAPPDSYFSYIEYPSHVLYLLWLFLYQRHWSFPSPLGPTDDPRNMSFPRHACSP